jgi:hypothetical protein
MGLCTPADGYHWLRQRPLTRQRAAGRTRRLAASSYHDQLGCMIKFWMRAQRGGLPALVALSPCRGHAPLQAQRALDAAKRSTRPRSIADGRSRELIIAGLP